MTKNESTQKPIWSCQKTCPSCELLLAYAMPTARSAKYNHRCIQSNSAHRFRSRTRATSVFVVLSLVALASQWHCQPCLFSGGILARRRTQRLCSTPRYRCVLKLKHAHKTKSGTHPTLIRPHIIEEYRPCQRPSEATVLLHRYFVSAF